MIFTCGVVLFPDIGNVKANDSSVADILERAENLQDNGFYSDAIITLDSALISARSLDDPHLVVDILLKQAFIHQVISENSKALSILFQAVSLIVEVADSSRLADVYVHLGAIYHSQNDYDQASSYYAQGLQIYERLGMKKAMAKCYNNYGSLAEDQGDPRKGLGFHHRSLAIWEELNEENWIGLSHIHLGVCYNLLDQVDSALYFLNLAKDRMEGQNRRRQMSWINNLIGNAYFKKKEYSKAIEFCTRGLELAEQLEVIRYMTVGCECLYKVHDASGNADAALEYYKTYIHLRDSVFGQDKAREITRIELDYKFEQQQYIDSLRVAEERHASELRHQEELSDEREERNIAMFVGIGILILAGSLWSRLRFVRRSRAIIQKERERSDDLLLNILPVEIAEELKDKGEATPQKFENVSILFTDFKGFTKASAEMDAADLVGEIDECFRAFDSICSIHGVEKIKTIGDAYMAAGGLPDPNRGSVDKVIEVAFEMQEFMTKRKAQRDEQGLPAFEMRVGIHSGPVVAGIVGINKFQYDIWGDSVNTAARMESNGEVGKVNISEATYQLVKDDPRFTFDFRGMIQAKGKGEMAMYFVQRIS